MNDQQFIERAHANPHDDSPEFLAAVARNPERQQLLDGLKRFDDVLKAGLSSVAPPAGLRQSLLDIPEGALHPDTAVAAANDSFWRRNARYAAVLVIAIGILAIFLQGETDPMEDLVFSHIYSELSFLDENNSLSLDEVNVAMISWVGSDLASTSDTQSLDISFTKDCWVDFANGVQAFHMIMQGNVGPVTVMIIPNTPLDAELAIADDRFEGMIRPTAGGNLVVVGEKNEAVRRYSTLLASNINW